MLSDEKHPERASRLCLLHTEKGLNNSHVFYQSLPMKHLISQLFFQLNQVLVLFSNPVIGLAQEKLFDLD